MAASGHQYHARNFFISQLLIAVSNNLVTEEYESRRHSRITVLARSEDADLN